MLGKEKEDYKIDIFKMQGADLRKELREKEQEDSIILLEYLRNIVNNKNKDKEKLQEKHMKYSTTISFSNLEIALLEEALTRYEKFIIEEPLSNSSTPNRMRLQESARLREKIETESTMAFYESSERIKKVIAKYK